MENTNIHLETGKKYTVYHCSDSAITQRMEITVVSLLETPVFKPDHLSSSRGRHRLGTYKRFRKRGEFYLEVRLEDMIILPGWDHPKTDIEAFGSFQCSATINIAASVEEIRELMKRNINPEFSAHDTIVAFPKSWNEMPGEEGILVYPEKPTQHAVIERLRHSTSNSSKP